MTAEALQTHLLELGFPTARVSWGKYRLVVPDWVRTQFFPYMVRLVNARKMRRYVTGRRNCKVFSLLAKVEAELLYGLSGDDDAQIAAGALYFQHRSGEWHAATLFPTGQRGEAPVLFDLTFALGGGNPFYTLNQEEIASCDFLYF